MIDIIGKIFENSEFWSDDEIKNCIDKENDGFHVYVNDLDEMYFLIEDCLDGSLLDRIISICANAEAIEKIRKKYKSNWVVVVIVKIQGELEWAQRKEILFIEENKYFCRKYVFWYNQEEKTAIETICNEDYTVQNIDDLIKNNVSFASFKEGDNIGYGCLSRIFIKLPFLNLTTMTTMDKSFMDYVRENVENLAGGLFEKLCTNDLDQIMEGIELQESNKKEIENRIKSWKEGV